MLQKLHLIFSKADLDPHGHGVSTREQTFVVGLLLNKKPKEDIEAEFKLGTQNIKVQNRKLLPIQHQS
jgi:hypothetical protein